MKKFYEKVCKLEELIALILVAGIAVLVFVSALMRTVGHPLNWAQDVALIAFAWLIFLGSDVAMRGSGLIGVDLFVKKFPAGVQKVLDILFKVIIAAFLCVLIYYRLRHDHHRLGTSDHFSAHQLQLGHDGCACRLLLYAHLHHPEHH